MIAIASQDRHARAAQRPIWLISPVCGTVSIGFFGLSGVTGVFGLSGVVGVLGLSGVVGVFGLSESSAFVVLTNTGIPS